MESKGRKILFYVILFLLPIAVFFITMGFGRYFLNVFDIIKAVFNIGNVSDINKNVVVSIRLPRILMAMVAGGGLSVAGVAFQAIFSNPLASPDVMGVSSGASFGAALGILAFANMVMAQVSALLFGIIAVALTYVLSAKKHTNGILVLVLSGVIISGFFTALVSLVKYVADPQTKLQEITFWLMGSLANTSYTKLLIMAALVVSGIVIIFAYRWRLNILSLSEEEIASLGVKAKQSRWTVIIAATLIVSGCVSMCGQIGWVGLVVPHLARSIVGADNRKVVPIAFSIGACYLAIVDTMCRSLTAGEIPLSILTAIIGVPLFVFMFYRKGNKCDL